MMKASLISAHPNCTHCGETCVDDSIQIDSYFFCCNGCKTVYEILNEHDLCSYYDIDAAAGIKIKASIGTKYVFLDQPEIVQRIIDFKHDNVVVIHFYIPSIHCSSCLWLLEKLYKIEPGIMRSDVSFTKKEISITFNDSIITLRRIVELLDSLGYAPQIELNKKSAGIQNKKEDRSIFYKMAVAAFCSSNIMLMSFPDYLGLDRQLDGTYAEVFGYISILLALPVLLYSASGLYISAWKGLRNKMINLDLPIVIGITALFLRSIYDILAHISPGYLDSFTGLIFFLLIGKWFQSKVYQSMSFDRDYQSYFPVAVQRTVNGMSQQVLINELKIGDQIYIRSQEIIPADAILLSAHAFIDYSFVSGETIPVRINKGELIYAGGRQTQGSIELLVEKEVSQSHLLQLWNNKVFDKVNDEKSISKIADTVGRNFTYGLLIISILTFLYWYGTSISAAFNNLTAVLIVACPCALALSIPFAYGNAIRILAKKGLFLRSADVVEKLDLVDTIVFDKTGTLTQSDVTSIGFVGESNIEKYFQQIHILVRQSTHPLSVQLANYLTKHTTSIKIENFKEIIGKGLEGIVEGTLYKIGSASFVGNPSAIDVNTSNVHVSVNDTYLGYFSIRNRYRTNLDTLIQQLAPNYALYVLSGDSSIEKHYLETIFPEAHHILFNQSPEDKLQFIKELQNQGKNVLMLGDGLNDAGALKQSDVGFAVSEDVYNFSPASDGILNAEKLGLLMRVLRFSKGSVNAVKSTLLFSLLYNIVVISMSVKGLFTPLAAAIIMPISSIIVVLMVVISTNFISKKVFK
ncbi:heavy metal translocating P-type ATPase metal-binding domain-containing protein [uncultured Cytophaga sp.]|uniref:heavy metal translocating P-type ATPase n=1 Tax=uncultured Cytophaga sp. TaxID=160238 RepID=UPI00261C6240|nr:heavy metal translocating P-type ATPase metal-binding domain-containing protein [uncultured Cytophaga sp.]